MRYFVIDVETYNNGTPVSKAIYEYATPSEAVATFHQRMGSAMKNAAVDEVLICVIDGKGGQYAQEYWKRPE